MSRPNGTVIKLSLPYKKKIAMKNVKVNTTLTNLKPLHAKCVITAYNELNADEETMKRGWQLTGLCSRKSKSIDDEKSQW